MITERSKYKTGRLTARPGAFTGKQETEKGILPLPLDNKKESFLYIPQEYDNTQPAALAVMLHGAGAPAGQGLSLLQQYADELNMVLLAPAAQTYTWDIIAGDAFGPDVILIDQALAHIFTAYAINPAQVAIGGFSDGASYGLSLGLTNGDLFTHIIAFSPGFAYALEKTGKPAVFISHGTRDQVLPIDPCSRRIVPQLLRQGLEVSYREFDGGHEIPPLISERAVEWFTRGSAHGL
ncbi:phospholipase [Pontibacter sp. 172403-2]|uniref:alpha/beta hydrolase n=1 Tax=Pontibacter rufus TaxID=2791028 RepID=UPI0018B005E1|nr:phospholipase [Pontibacter sp. 172403-2]MBF9252556.1 phospholipase [Pontibacter sp. 172403-2]